MRHGDGTREAGSGEHEIWRMLEQGDRAFRFVQHAIFNLSEAEEEILEQLREGGLEFGLLPRPDPTSFLTLSIRLNQHTQRVDVEVDRGSPASCSFVTRRNAFAEALKGCLDRIFGGEHFDSRRYVASRRYVWYPYILPASAPAPRPPSPDSRLRRSIFNFEPKERHFLGLLEAAVARLGPRLPAPLKVHVYPREKPFGGIELMVLQGDRRQPARVFVKGFYPVTYHLITENTGMGSLLKDYLDEALGAEHLDGESSRTKGRFLSLIYSVRHPRSILEGFET